MVENIYIQQSFLKRILNKFKLIKPKYSKLPTPVIDTSKEKVLDVGCGTNKLPGAIGIDISQLDGVDIIHDLNIIPWKGIEDGSFDWVLMKDVLEHLNDPINVIKEAYRILKPDGKLYIRVTYWNHKYSFSDPTHKHAFSEIYFTFFIGERRPYYMDFKFKDLKIEYTYDANAIRKFGNNRKRLHEKAYFYCNIIDGMHITLIK
jgi:ubiquinone/menaquinone biosynthesis C-methylase UbiE